MQRQPSPKRLSICGGRSAVRQILYMAILVAVRHSRVIQALYDQLLQRGKPTKVTLVACMHRRLTILNAMLKNGTEWRSPIPIPIIPEPTPLPT